VRACGLRLSASRRLVLEALFAAAGPVSAEAIADGLAGRLPPADLASTYRNLETLERIASSATSTSGTGPAATRSSGHPSGNTSPATAATRSSR